MMLNLIKKKLSGRTPAGSRGPGLMMNNQKGAMLVALVVTIIILGLLAGAVVSMFSSSTLNSISANFAQRSYYNAEAGINYVKALYRNAESPEAGKAALRNYESKQTIEMPDGGKADVLIQGLTDTYTPATATCVTEVTNSDTIKLKVTSDTNNVFASSIGFFKKDGDKTIYHYIGRSNSEGNITLTNVLPLITAAQDVNFTTVEMATIESNGKYGLLWNRKVNYKWPLSGSRYGNFGGSPYEPDNQDVTKFEYSQFNKDGSNIIAAVINAFRSLIAIFTGKDPNLITGVDVMRWWFEDQRNLVYPNSGCGYLAQSWGSYQWDSGQSAIKTNESTAWIGGMGGFFLPFNAEFAAERANAGGRLNYDAQTKMRVEGWNKRNYLLGLSVRADSRCWASGWDPVVINQYGISYARGHNNMFNLPTDTDPYIVFWRSLGDSFKLIAYKKLTFDEGVLDGVVEPVDPMDSTTSKRWSENDDYSYEWSADSGVGHNANGSYHVNLEAGTLQRRAGLVRDINLPDDVDGATLTFWTKTGSNGLDNCTLDIRMADRNGTWIEWDAPNSAYTPTNSWQQITVPLENYTGIQIGHAAKLEFYARTRHGVCDAYIDDVQLSYYKLRDWVTLGVRVREKPGTDGNMSNEFEIFYGHPSGDHGTGPNDIVVDVNRAANPRNENNWLPQSPINTMASTSDKLTVVSSTTSDGNTAAANPWYWWYKENGNYVSKLAKGNTRPSENNCSYTLASGGSKEPYVVIKTAGSDCRTTDTYYTGSNKPEEFAIHVYSNSTWNTWFDDTNILWTNRSSSYGSGVQY